MHALRASLICLLSVSAIRAAEIPVTAVTLYKHGVGLFIRDGTIPAGEEARLEFQTSDMNDLLKSLIVTVPNGVHIKSIRYDANETLAQRLSKFPFHVGDQQPVSSFLDSLKGSRIQLTLGPRTVTGSIVGARLLSGTNASPQEQITLLTDSGGLENVDLSSANSLQLLDSHQQQELKAYLETLADASARDRRSVFIESTTRDAQPLHISYVAPTAIWKSSYRLSLDDRGPSLEGWAILDNTTGDDWNNVRLSVVSGRPISFISQLDTARYGQRVVAELPEDRAAGPVVYGGALDVAPLVSPKTVPAPREPSAGNAEDVGAGVIGGVLGGVGPATTRQFLNNQLSAPKMASESSVQGATGASLGELFEYNFADRVTIKKNQSAMLPFLQSKVQARKLLIWTEQDGEHPVNAAELTNNTNKTLDGGPVTVYDAGAYAGEALFETLKPADKRLLGYAVDYGTRVSTAFNSGQQFAREVKVENGILNVRYVQRDTVTYTVRNVDAKPKTLIVQRPAASDFTLISPKPLERTSDAYRFQIELPSNAGQVLKVESEQSIWNAIEVSSATPDSLAVFTANQDISQAARTQLAHIVDLKHSLVSAQASLDGIRQQLTELSSDQSRLRSNIDSLNKVSGEESRVHTYSAQLAALEDRIAKLRAQSSDQAAAKAALEQQLRDSIAKLAF